MRSRLRSTTSRRCRHDEREGGRHGNRHENKQKDRYGDACGGAGDDHHRHRGRHRLGEVNLHDDLTLEERRTINYDHPDALDTDLLVRHLEELRAGRAVDCPTYDFTQHTRAKKTVAIQPSRVIIVEGILIFQDARLRDLFDIKIYVEADADERILRRVARDIRERGRSLESVINQYLTTVKPMHYLYVEPTKTFADLILNSGRNDVAFDVMKTKIEALLGEG